MNNWLQRPCLPPSLQAVQTSLLGLRWVNCPLSHASREAVEALGRMQCYREGGRRVLWSLHVYAYTSALIVLSHNDRGITALIVKKKQSIYGNQALGFIHVIILWVFVHHLQEGYLCGKFEVSSPNGHAGRAFVTVRFYIIDDPTVIHTWVSYTRILVAWPLKSAFQVIKLCISFTPFHRKGIM